MQRFLRLKTVAMLIACCGLVFPARMQAAVPDTSATSPISPAAAQPRLITDVALGENGRLSGQAIDGSGMPAADKAVTLLQQGIEVAHTHTDATGRFTVNHLTGGIYEVHCENGGGLARLWAPHTAPPAARAVLVVSCGAPIVRGQHTMGPFDGSWLKGRGPWIIAAAAIVAVPTALALGLKPKSAAS